MAFKPRTYEEALAKKLSRKPKIRRSKVKKPKLKTISQLKKTLWETIKIYVRERDQSICFTSGVKVEGSNRHVGHGIPSSVGGVLLRYHPWNLHIQSYVENIHHSGNGGVYYRNQLARYGQEKVDRIYELKKHSAQCDRYFLTTLNELYKAGDEEEIVKFIESYI
tara:strand:- start:6595 stop:7089 length:495 start_codon:yes stop_codon:yes gene_type:complete